MPRARATTLAPPVLSVSDPEPDPKARRIARKSKRQDNRRQVLLACAREVLLAHGPVAFTMARLAYAAATSNAALYYYVRPRQVLPATPALPLLSLHLDAPNFAAHNPRMHGFHARYMCTFKAMRAWAHMVRQLDIDIIAPPHLRYFPAPMVGQFIAWCEGLACGTDLMDNAYRVPV